MRSPAVTALPRQTRQTGSNVSTGLEQTTESRSRMLDVFEWDKAHAYGRHRNVAIQMWRGTVEARHVPIMEARWQSIASESSEFGILVVVLPSAPTPSSARREE